MTIENKLEYVLHFYVNSSVQRVHTCMYMYTFWVCTIPTQKLSHMLPMYMHSRKLLKLKPN